MKDQNNETLLKIYGSLKNIETLLNSRLKLELAPILKSEINSKEKILVYQMTGNFSRDQIAKKSGLSTWKISKLWARWEEIGLVIKDGQKYKKIF